MLGIFAKFPPLRGWYRNFVIFGQIGHAAADTTAIKSVTNVFSREKLSPMNIPENVLLVLCVHC